jgi:hypothetical protein
MNKRTDWHPISEPPPEHVPLLIAIYCDMTDQLPREPITYHCAFALFHDGHWYNLEEDPFNADTPQDDQDWDTLTTGGDFHTLHTNAATMELLNGFPVVAWARPEITLPRSIIKHLATLPIPKVPPPPESTL